MAQINRPDAGRPDPDALLAAFRRETAGRLKVFLGAAPGVGKTYAMLQNARRLNEYHGRTIEEFDLDGALKRKPKLIIVDELAHSNAPDCRHPKRWQDVQ